MSKKGEARVYMVRLRAKELLEEQRKSKYWLFKQLGMSYQSVSRMLNNETQSIQFGCIDTLCQIFHCSPQDLFEYSDEEEQI